MYSFAQRDDTRVVDEPLYAHYLAVSGADHPGRDEVLASQSRDAQEVIRRVVLGPCDRPILFIKQMAHHLADIDLGFVHQTLNAFLIRNPVEMLPSLMKQIPRPDLASTGLDWQANLHRQLVAEGEHPVVLDAMEVLLNPEAVLRKACIELEIDFDPKMLNWRAGPRPEDGVWAKYWYDSVHRSTGFEPYRRKTASIPPEFHPLLEQCQRHYQYLYRYAIKST
jgi:hypothetical protein